MRSPKLPSLGKSGLCSLVLPALIVAAGSGNRVALAAGDPVAGQATFNQKCAGCHSASSLQAAASRITTNLGSINSAMRNITLTTTEVANLQAYLTGSTTTPPPPPPPPPPSSGGDATAGQATFNQKCAGCHTAASLQPFASLITTNLGSINSAMRNITLTTTEVANLQAYLTGSSTTPPPTPNPTPTFPPLPPPPPGGRGNATGSMVVLGYNDLGMHCMNADFSELMVLPPYNNLHAQVIQRGEEPRIVTSGVTVNYSIPGNTTSANKTNFWTYVQSLMGVTLQPNVGLTGNSLAGTMKATGTNDWSATGIPITPIMDDGSKNSYALSLIQVMQNGREVCRTQSVVPVSTEMRCDLCHSASGGSVYTNVLRSHDQLHGTTLASQKPVLCQKCHSDNALGMAGVAGVPSLSSAMHTAHAPRMAAAGLTEQCYACHPGVQTQCLRDVHYSKGFTCETCHGDMTAVANPARNPWVDEPRCSNCHTRSGFQFEQANTLFRDSKGHSNVHCEACHGSPHAITPTVDDQDNVQAIAMQGHAGVINTCTVCHTQTPDGSFFHRVSEEGGNTGGGSGGDGGSTGGGSTGDAAAGQATFNQKCAGCHSASSLRSAASRITTNLGSINSAMRNITLTTTEVANLQAYLAGSTTPPSSGGGDGGSTGGDGGSTGGSTDGGRTGDGSRSRDGSYRRSRGD